MNFSNSSRIPTITYGEGQEEDTASSIIRDQTNLSWFKIGGTNFKSPVHRQEGGEFLENLKITYVERQEKCICKFHRDQTNLSWFIIGRTNFWGPVYRGKGGDFF